MYMRNTIRFMGPAVVQAVIDVCDKYSGEGSGPGTMRWEHCPPYREQIVEEVNLRWQEITGASEDKNWAWVRPLSESCVAYVSGQYRRLGEGVKQDLVKDFLRANLTSEIPVV